MASAAACIAFSLLVMSGCASSGDPQQSTPDSGCAGNGCIPADSGWPDSSGSAGAAGTGGVSGIGGVAGASAAGGSAGTGGSAGAGCPHPPVNDPSADDSALPPGPIVKYTVHVYYFKRPPNDEIITPVEQNGKWYAKVGDKIVFDSTQKNADNVPCQWENEPEYHFSDSCAFERLGTSNPFLAQLVALAPGEISVYATIDGVTSNTRIVVAEP